MDLYIAIIFLALGLIVMIAILVGVLVWVFSSPFKYPYKVIVFDISGRRDPKDEDLVDNYMIHHGFSPFSEHFKYVQKWKNECENRIANGKLKNRRIQQYLDCLDDEHMFQFDVKRMQTRYRQRNYVKSSYHVSIVVSQFSSNYAELEQRYQRLKEIGFECTLSEYYAKNQRKMMTKSLRHQIAERDHYTCQICGKYMPDGVGLHIDHIVPIAKGGKSVPSNLQVLCSKCNGKKSSK